MSEIQYPIGKFYFEESSAIHRQKCIDQFRTAPKLLREAVAGLDKKQLLSCYRPGGWTIAQIVHHLAEADANAYSRLKYALTEDVPKVMVAPEALWAELPDAKSVLLTGSLLMFEGIRLRWVEAWESIREEDYKRQWNHSRYGMLTVDHLLQQYAWHARHHTAQILSYRKLMGW